MPLNPLRRRFTWRLITASSLLAGLLPSALAQGAALEVEGQSIARRARVAGTELHLNGTGIRQVAWFKGFVAALYLRERAAAPMQAVAMAGPKRLQLRMLHEVPAVEFVKALRKGIERNAAPTELPALAARIDRFAQLVDALGTVRKGDVVDLDFDPGRGMSFSVNGKLRGEPIPGDAFYNALLLSFIGERPYDQRLKAGLLGRPG